MSAQEWVAAITALICVWLTIKNKIENWPWGIVSVLIYGWIFWKTRLYANAGLQIFIFLPCCIYGWWVWARCGPTHNDDLPVMAMSRRANLAWLVVSILLSLLISVLMMRTNDPNPYADGFVTGMSIVGQFLQAKKLFENWWYWIGVDALAAGYLFPVQQLYVTTALYAVFFFLAIWGAVEWRPLIGKEVVRA